MFRIATLFLFLMLVSGCSANDHQASDATSAEAQAENSRLKTEAAALRKAVDGQQAVLETLQQR